MAYTTLISPADLNMQLDQPNTAIFDCRFYLAQPEQGFQEYQESHIPGAIYVNLDQDLSGEIITGKTGRHPLPEIHTISKRFGSWGIDNTTQVFIYDNLNGAIAARLWWTLKWLGHDHAAVLDGGWEAWLNADLPLSNQIPDPQQKRFYPQVRDYLVADLGYVEEIRLDPEHLLVDARSAERFWGLDEPIDPRAGHIAGAVSAPYTENLNQEGFFLPEYELKDRFDNLLGDIPVQNVTMYCGSGVTSIHNMIAMVIAGYEMPKLYPGSWSEWSADPDRPAGP
jgi:thiosulfate/3-mercaptopyruvate sulfurtransferase